MVKLYGCYHTKPLGYTCYPKILWLRSSLECAFL